MSSVVRNLMQGALDLAAMLSEHPIMLDAMEHAELLDWTADREVRRFAVHQQYRCTDTLVLMFGAKEDHRAVS